MCCFCTLHICDCVYVNLPLMLSVYFYVFLSNWYVCVRASDKYYRDVFIDGRHGAQRHFLCLLIIKQLVSSFSLLLFLPFYHLYLCHFLTFLSLIIYFFYPPSFFFSIVFFFSYFLILCPPFTLFLYLSPSLQSVGPVWTTPPSSPQDPPCSQVAVKVLAAAALAAAWEGAWDTTAVTLPSPIPSTTWPSCRRPTSWPWSRRSAATAP